MFERKTYEALAEWKRISNGRTAALIEGARRVGKSTVAEAFARAEYDDYLLLDFSQESEEVRRNFRENIGNLDTFFRNLFLLKGKSLVPGTSVIILDEVQLFPLARQAVKQLVRDGRYHYIETGSLISIKQNTERILVPSEEHRIRMHPMDFEEFLWAQGDTMTYPVLKKHFTTRKPMGGLHQTVMKVFREYMLIGGMPQVVSAFVPKKDFAAADFVKQQILSLYKNDMAEQNEERSEYVTDFFNGIPAELSQHDKCYVLAHINDQARMREYRGPIRWLDEAMIVNIASKVDEPSAALNLSISDPRFKCYMADTGLLVSLAFSDRPFLENDLYLSVLNDRLGVNEGMLIENVVAQSLKASGHRLFFYTQRNPSTRKTLMDIDFLIRSGKKIVPIEVKSADSCNLKSLLRLKEIYGKRIGDAIVLHHGEIKDENGIVFLPYYMAPLL